MAEQPTPTAHRPEAPARRRRPQRRRHPRRRAGRAGGRSRGQHGRDRPPRRCRPRHDLRALPDPRVLVSSRHEARHRPGRGRHPRVRAASGDRRRRCAACSARPGGSSTTSTPSSRSTSPGSQPKELRRRPARDRAVRSARRARPSAGRLQRRRLRAPGSSPGCARSAMRRAPSYRPDGSQEAEVEQTMLTTALCSGQTPVAKVSLNFMHRRVTHRSVATGRVLR